MKQLKYLIGILTILAFFSANLFAQEEEMTTEEWEAEIANLSQKKADLTKQIEQLQGEVNNLTSKKNAMQSYEDCVSETYALVGANDADVAEFSNKINDLNARINSHQPTKADRQAELDALKSSKLSALPQFYSIVHNQLQSMIDAWPVEDISYTVVRGDHLWGIAKKKQHYGNGFAWPKIYNANRDQIKNPDLIYPNQNLTIPKLTEEEKSKYDKLKANYKAAPMQ